jgi:hypothetical protein
MHTEVFPPWFFPSLSLAVGVWLLVWLALKLRAHARERRRRIKSRKFVAYLSAWEWVTNLSRRRVLRLTDQRSRR